MGGLAESCEASGFRFYSLSNKFQQEACYVRMCRKQLSTQVSEQSVK